MMQTEALHHLFGRVVLEAIVPAAVGLMRIDTDCFLIHVSLYDVSIETTAHEHRALYVDPVADFEQVEVRQTQGLLHRRNGIQVALYANNRQTHAVMRDGLIDAERFAEGVAKREMFIGLLGLRPEPLFLRFLRTF